MGKLRHWIVGGFWSRPLSSKAQSWVSNTGSPGLESMLVTSCCSVLSVGFKHFFYKFSRDLGLIYISEGVPLFNNLWFSLYSTLCCSFLVKLLLEWLKGWHMSDGKITELDVGDQFSEGIAIFFASHTLNNCHKE